MAKLFHFSLHLEKQLISLNHSLVIKAQCVNLCLSKTYGLLSSKSTFIAYRLTLGC